MSPILRLQDIEQHFQRPGRPPLRAIDGVSLSIAPGEVLGLVGESGCGKSTLGRVALRLLRPDFGQVWFQDQRIDQLPERRMRPLRKQMQVVFQDPFASLNPRKTIHQALAEPLAAHRVLPRRRHADRVAELLREVDLDPRFARKYPHEFSGGQRQRIAIARALSLQPRLIVADEPVSALDVSVQAGILNLFARLNREQGLALLFISHDLAVVRRLAHRVAVMYRGRILETAPTREIFDNPLHPYTQLLLEASPRPDPAAEPTIPPAPPVVRGESEAQPIPDACPFHPRCPHATERCRNEPAKLQTTGGEHAHACLRRQLGELPTPSTIREHR